MKRSEVEFIEALKKVGLSRSLCESVNDIRRAVFENEEEHTGKKYELTFVTNDWNGHILHRIRALKDFGDVKAGDPGGWVVSENNLSQEGDCWVSGNAVVFENAKVYGDAKVSGKAEVYGNAKVYGNAEVSEYAWVSGETEVYGNAKVYGNAHVHGNAKVYGDAKVSGYAAVYKGAYDNGVIDF